MGTELATAVPLGLSMDTVAARVVASSGRRASEDAVRVALRLRECRAAQGGRLLLFVPASSGDSVHRLIDETAVALEQLRESPVLVLDLARADGERDPWLSQWPIAPEFHARAGQPGPSLAAVAGPTTPVAYAQPIASAPATIPFLASPEFAAMAAAARARFSYVLCTIGPISHAVGSLVAAALCDGVVLSVTADRTTLAEVQAASRQLERVHAPVLGFVVNRETARRS